MLDIDPGLPTALVDFPSQDGGGRQRWHFRTPRQWLVAHDAHQVPALLDAAHQLAQDGAWCVGWVAYEAAPAFNPHLPVKAARPGAVYAVWAVFDRAEPGWPAPAEGSSGSWQLGPWERAIDDHALQGQIEQVRELIRQGEVYQVNLTAPLSGLLTGADRSAATTATLHAAFQALHRSQPDGYAVMLDGRAASRTPGAVLSVSPELFFDWDGEAITTRPMKGTAPRGSDPADDQAQAQALRASTKEQAENLMIVDLLRNDLSRVAQVGSVQVPSLFDVQALPTVWQMTSTVTARTRPGTCLSDVFAALFPCGSVTGAPKRQAMHHIARLERSPRGVYCGAVGLMAPGGRVTFNVPIRTVSVNTLPPPAPWSAQCGIGSGITLDATPAGELREWRHKQAFLTRAAQPFELLESLRLQDGVWQRVDRHLARLHAASLAFRFVEATAWPHVTQGIVAELDRQAGLHPSGSFKGRLCMAPGGGIRLEVSPLADTPMPVRVSWAHRPMPDADAFIRHKTTQRSAYQAFVAPPDYFDTLLYNAHGEVTEFTIGNVAVCLDGRWVTPPLSAGLLPGVMRATLLAEGRLHEAPVHIGDIARASGLALINSVRGWVDVDLSDVQHQPLPALPA